jgi:cell wall-associated NlpC family hydrolase
MAPAVLLLLVFVLVLSAAGCATSGAVPRPFPGAAPAKTSAGTPPASESIVAWTSQVIETALGLRGVPYRNGGSEPTGFDCSGFVQYVFGLHGTPLPREVRDQFGLGYEIGRGEIRAGDLVFFQTVSRGPSHVGLALGDHLFVHAPSSSGVVRVERYTDRYWSARFVGARRLF